MKMRHARKRTRPSEPTLKAALCGSCFVVFDKEDLVVDENGYVLKVIGGGHRINLPDARLYDAKSQTTYSSVFDYIKQFEDIDPFEHPVPQHI